MQLRRRVRIFQVFFSAVQFAIALPVIKEIIKAQKMQTTVSEKARRIPEEAPAGRGHGKLIWKSNTQKKI